MRTLVVLGLLYVWGAPLAAQVPVGLSPPTYGFPSSTLPGGPLNGYEVRVFRTHELVFELDVPIAELQEVLPPGYTVIAPVVSVRVVYQQRSEVTADADGVTPGTYGPSSLVQVLATVRTSVGTAEAVILVEERSTQAGVELANLLFGEGSTRLADRLTIEIEEEEAGLRFKARLADDELGLAFRAEANVPAAIVIRGMTNPVPIPIRFLNGMVPNTRFHAADTADFIDVPTAGNFTLNIPGKQLRLPAGNLTISSIRPMMRMNRWKELFVKLEPGF